MKTAILYLTFASKLLWQTTDALEQPQDVKTPNDPLNLVILFADNLGYDDVSCFQSQEATAGKYSSRSTPNIDRLAGEGVKFTNWNSAAALCSASRSALLTGKYPVRTGTYPRVFRNDATFGLLPEETTLAELLKVEGYATSIV
jgi:arylsulfatase A